MHCQDCGQQVIHPPCRRQYCDLTWIKRLYYYSVHGKSNKVTYCRSCAGRYYHGAFAVDFNSVREDAKQHVCSECESASTAWFAAQQHSENQNQQYRNQYSEYSAVTTIAVAEPAGDPWTHWRSDDSGA